jgi:hypothetical protein
MHMAEKSKWQGTQVKAEPEAKPSNVVTSTSLHKEKAPDEPKGKALGSKLPAREDKPEQAKAKKGEPFVQPSSANAQRFTESKEDKRAAKEAE